VTPAELKAHKRVGRKIVAVVAWDVQTARILDRAGVDIVSVGDSVGINLWGRDDPLEVTMDEMVLVCRAVRRGVTRALVSCDFPYGPLQDGPASAVRAARRLASEGGADVVKLDGADDHLDAVDAVAAAGVPVFAQFGTTPQSGGRTHDADELVAQAGALEEAGASLLDFTHSGPVAGPLVVAAVYFTQQAKKKMTTKQADAMFAGILRNAQLVNGHTNQSTLLAAGQYSVVVSGHAQSLEQLQTKHAPVAFGPPFVTPVIERPQGIGISYRLPHPAAALLFYDWMLRGGGGGGQSVLLANGVQPANPYLQDNAFASHPFKVEMDIRPIVAHFQQWEKKYASFTRLGKS
jgi:3-methyl-2-oxobutanoate hydroxymethyltransferase